MNDRTGADLEIRVVDSPATTVDSLPVAPTRVGFIFAGWNTAPGGDGLPFTVNTPVKANIAVYAQWGNAYSYTVTFNNNGGSAPADPAAKTVVEPATTVDALPVPPGKTGQVFNGWNTAADGSGTAFTASTTVTANLTVYAQWVMAYTYTVTFNNNGGTTPADPAAKTVVEPATTIDALPVPPGKTGHVFARWTAAADGSGAAFTAGTTVTADITVYAQWTVPYTYTVTFNNNGGSAPANPATKQVSAPATTVDALPVPPKKTGYVFDGWNTSMTGAYGMPFTETTAVTGNLTVYAQWKSYSYTVTFNVNGGDAPADPPARTVSSPATTVGSLPTTPVKAGANFDGWNTAADGTGTAFTAGTTITANITVYAR
jgi:uncharacterized repeat protein (TIGR02543 family)